MLELIRELVVNYGRAEQKVGAHANDDSREDAQEAFTLLQEAIEELEAKAARLDDLEKPKAEPDGFCYQCDQPMVEGDIDHIVGAGENVCCSQKCVDAYWAAR